MKKMLKHLTILVCVFCMLFVSFACGKKGNSIGNASGVTPNQSKLSGEPNLDFVEMHNYVIDSITGQYTPFFYIKEGKFDISGDNSKKVIKITCTCMDGTTVEDLDLFLSMVLNYVAENAAEQDFRFKKPTTDKEGTYIDFGNVFNHYDLEIYSTTESGTVLRNDYIKAGNKIPIDPRYIME